MSVQNRFSGVGILTTSKGWYDLIKQKALDAGALGCGISGSGPTIFALSTERQLAVAVGNRCQEEFARLKLHSEVYISKINTHGAKVID